MLNTINTNRAAGQKNYTVRMSSGAEGVIIEDTNTHTRSEIIDRAKEVLAKEMSQDLASFADLEVKMVREGDSDKTYFVDKSGKSVEFTEEMQFKAALAVLNSQKQFFEATPVN